MILLLLSHALYYMMAYVLLLPCGAEALVQN